MKTKYLPRLVFLIFILLSCIQNNCNAYGESIPDTAKKSLIFAPEHHFSEDLLEYFNYLHKDYSQRYFLENKTYLEAAFFSLNNRFFCFGELEVNVGLGRQSGAILLDPREIDEGFGPMLEYRMPEYTVKFGLDHHCFHQIDRDEWNTLYWNKVFAGFGSANLRDGEFKEYLRRNVSLNLRQRLTWQVGYGFFVHKLSGILDTNALSWGNAYIHELSTNCRWTPYVYRGYAAVASWNNKVRVDRAGRWLWTEEVRAEAMVIHGAYGLSVYYDWVFLDQSIPRENRDRLMEAGIRIFM